MNFIEMVFKLFELSEKIEALQKKLISFYNVMNFFGDAVKRRYFGKLNLNLIKKC